MATHALLILSVISAAWSIPTPCPEGGCKNFTVYLGPRWGSKIIYPNYPKLRGPTEEEAGSTKNNDISADSFHHDSSVILNHLYPQHKPVPDDNSFSVNYSEEEESPATMTNRSWHGRTTHPAAADSNVFLTRALDLTGLALANHGLKTALSNLTVDERRHLRRLYLVRNNIRYIERLTFPVELEYSLLELRLDDNPLGTTSGNTRLEISRLKSLLTLTLARTGLYYLETLHLPSLQVLDLRGNRLMSIDYPWLQRLHNLHELYLDDNCLTTLYVPSLTHLTQLRVLSLSGNRMSYISGDPRWQLPQLQVLHLNNNSLTSVNKVDEFSAQWLYLGDNPWNCSCPLLEAARRSWPEVVDRDTLTCWLDDSLRLVSSLRERDVHLGCPGRWQWFLDRLEQKMLWVERQCPRMSLTSLLGLLGWILFAAVVVLKVRRNLRAKKKVASAEVLYNVLDDKQAA